MPAIVINLRNNQNLSYFGTIGVGNQQFDVTFNTGMHDIWIPERIVAWIRGIGRRAEGVRRRVMRRQYDSNSPTYNQLPGTEGYIKVQPDSVVSLRGTRRTELFRLGANHITHEFVVYNYIDPTTYYTRMECDGFVGLGFPHLNNHYNIGGSDPIWVSMMNMLPRNIFSLYLQHQDTDNITAGGSQIIFGDADQRHFQNEHVYYNLVHGSSYTWMIQLNSVQVAGKPAIANICSRVLIDSGCKYIYGPSDIICEINKQIFNRNDVGRNGEETYFAFGGEYENRRRMPAVFFTFGDGGPSYNIEPRYFACRDETGPGNFSSVFKPMDFDPNEERYMILGLPFLRRYHTIFDFGERRIGFSLANG